MMTPPFALLWSDRSRVPPGDAWLSLAEAKEARAFLHERRRADFLLRRCTARLALQAHNGIAPGSVEIRRDEQGAPSCLVDGRPAPLSISLSDREGRALCLVGPPGAALGCDIEWIEPRTPAFVEQFLSPAEANRVGAATPADRPLLANLAWSGKESALKALGVGLRRDTRTVTVDWSPPLPAWGRLRVTVPGEAIFDGWWRIVEGWVVTVVAAHMDEPPAILSVPRASGPDYWTQSD